MKLEISCDMVLDLMPLVRDETASEDSKNLVLSHIKHCQSCREIYEAMPCAGKVDDKRILRSIRRRLSLTAAVLFLFGGLAGVFLSNGIGMFYNFLLTPAFGAAGYVLLPHKKYLIPAGMFSISYLWLFVYHLHSGMLQDGWNSLILTAPLYLTVIYTLLTLLGMLITWLLQFAFRRGKTK